MQIAAYEIVLLSKPFLFFLSAINATAITAPVKIIANIYSAIWLTLSLLTPFISLEFPFVKCIPEQTNSAIKAAPAKQPVKIYVSLLRLINSAIAQAAITTTSTSAGANNIATILSCTKVSASSTIPAAAA